MAGRQNGSQIWGISLDIAQAMGISINSFYTRPMKTIDDIIMSHLGSEGPLLPILHDLQAEFGHVGEDAIRQIALALNLSRAEVHGVVSFYHDFTVTPEPRQVVKLCRAEACQSRGQAALERIAEGAVGVRIETVYCLGLCAAGPAAMIGEEVYARLTPARFAALLKAMR